MQLAAHDDGGRSILDHLQARQRILEHTRTGPDQRQELLGVVLPGQRPQARPRTARENDGVNGHASPLFNLFIASLRVVNPFEFLLYSLTQRLVMVRRLRGLGHVALDEAQRAVRVTLGEMLRYQKQTQLNP